MTKLTLRTIWQFHGSLLYRRSIVRRAVLGVVGLIRVPPTTGTVGHQLLLYLYSSSDRSYYRPIGSGEKTFTVMNNRSKPISYMKAGPDKMTRRAKAIFRDLQ